MVRSRAVRVAFTAALLGGVGWGWFVGGRAAVTFDARVVDVIDGDTVVVRHARGGHDTVRLLGVDTPETRHPERGVECYGPEATAYTRARLAGRTVTLERDAEARDRYGRLLAYVRVDGRRFNDELLRGGYARVMFIPPNAEHARAMLAAEADARRSGRGMWSACRTLSS